MWRKSIGVKLILVVGFILILSIGIFAEIEDLKDELKGDVKHLTNYSPEYRLKIENYRILFELEDDKIIIYRIKHRESVYR